MFIFWLYLTFFLHTRTK